MFVTSTPFCASAEGLPHQLGDYVVQRFLGEGGFGKVTKCLNSRTGEVVALKIFEYGAEGDAKRELAILQHLNNTIEPHNVNIIKYIDHFTWEKYSCIAYEVLDCSLLDFYCQRQLPFSLNEMRPIAHQLLVAFEALKKAHVLHTDLKADNIMLVNHEEQPFKVKLIDFGSGGFFSELQQGMIIMTDEYRAPEVTLGAPLSEALEMWSLGCCLAEGFLGCQIFSDASNYDNLRTIIHLIGQPSDEMLNRSVYAEKFFLKTSSQWTFKTPVEYQDTQLEKPEIAHCPLDEAPNLEAAIMHCAENLDEDVHLDLKAFVDFLKNLLQTDPEKRLTTSEALTHPFLTMEQLTTNNSEHVRKARDLMSVTLQTSAPAPVEGKASKDQHSQPCGAATERPGSSSGFGDQHCPPEDHHNMSPHAEVKGAKKEVEDYFMNYEVTDKKNTIHQADQRLEEQLHSCSIKIDQRMETHGETTEAEHVVIVQADCFEDDANEPETAAKRAHNSASFWLTVRSIFFGGVRALQAAPCYVLSLCFLCGYMEPQNNQNVVPIQSIY